MKKRSQKAMATTRRLARFANRLMADLRAEFQPEPEPEPRWVVPHGYYDRLRQQQAVAQQCATLGANAALSAQQQQAAMAAQQAMAAAHGGTFEPRGWGLYP
jgi:hypothetical protein